MRSTDESLFAGLPFSLDLAARISGLSETKIRRWVNEKVFVTDYAEIGDPRHGKRTFSYRDVAILRVFAMLRDEGVALAALAELGLHLKTLPVQEWRKTSLVVEDGAVALAADGQASHGREHMNGTHGAAWIPLARVLDQVAEIVREIDERLDQVGRVSQDRRVMQGQPVLAGTRIPTATIHYFIKNGYSREWILKNYSRLKDADITAAISFEESRLDARQAS